MVYPQIVRAARELGVTRPHLYMVLQGTRTSASLLARYQEWREGMKDEGGRMKGAKSGGMKAGRKGVAK